MRRFFVLAVILSFVLLGAANIYASGFFVYHQDTKAQGQAGAFTAQADNPSAIYYNPAGMSQLDGTQVSIGSRFFRLETEYKNILGEKQNLEAGWEAVPSGFITSKFGTEKFTFGLGAYAPYGLSTRWSDTGLLRYAATYTSLKLFDINPSVAFQIVPEFSIGAGVDYYNAYSYVSELETNFVAADAETKADVSGDGWGFNLGAMWKPHPKHSFGAAYRSKVDIECTGDLTTKGIPAGLGYPSILTYDVKTDANMPQIASFGYAFRPVEKLKLEADVYWVGFSIFDKATIKERHTDTILSNAEKDWNDTFIFALGGEYLLTDHWALRAGYSYQQNAVPEKTFNPNVPDANLNVIALGLGYTFERFTIDVAYALGLYNNRDIDNDVGKSVGTTVDGSYDSLIHILGVTAGFKF